MRGDTKLGGERQTLSHDAAMAIYRSLTECDSVIERQSAVIGNANLEIGEALTKMRAAEEARKGLSDQLDRFAPEGFMSSPAVIDGAAPAPPMAATGVSFGLGTVPPFPPAPSSAGTGHPVYPVGYVKPWHKPSRLPQRVNRAMPSPAPSWE